MRWIVVVLGAAGVLAPSTSLAAPIFDLATFTPVGNPTNVEFTPPTASSQGILQSIPGAGGVLQFAASPQPVNRFWSGYAVLDTLNALGALPVKLELTLFYPETFPYMHGTVSPVGTLAFVYAGATPFTVGGQSYAAGATLLSIAPNYLVDGGFGSSDGISIYPEESETFQTDIAGLEGAFQVSSSGNFYLDIENIDPPMGERLNFPNIETAPSFIGDLGVIPFSTGVPEPATWAAMLAGMGMLGAMARRRQLAVR